MSTETATTFRVGDRVRRVYDTRIGTIFEVDEPTGDCHVTWGRGHSSWSYGNLELVERAHYAPPGVAMLALTPEVLALFEGMPTMGKFEKIVDAVSAALKADGKQWPAPCRAVRVDSALG